MKLQTTTAAVLLTIAALNCAVLAQPPKGKAPDDPPPSADRPRLEAPPNLDPPGNPRPRREPRPDDDGPPPPAKAGARPRGDGPGYPQAAPMPVPVLPGTGGFGGGMRSSGGPGMPGGFGGGFGGGMRGGGGFGGGMPGAVNPFGEPPHDDPEMRELMKQDADLEHQTMQTAHRYREATGDERQKIRDSLADTVSKHFDVRQKRRELQIKRMDEELKRLREEIAKRNDARKSIIDNRLREMTGEPRDLDF